MEIDPEFRKKIIGDEQPINCRPADLLKPELEKLKEEVKPFAEQEEDVLSFAQFGSVAQKFFERRRNRRFGVDSDGVDFKNKIHSI